MANPQDQFIALAQQTQQAVLNAVESWTRTVQQAVGQTPMSAGGANVEQVIDQVFDFAVKMLEMQRDFAKNLVHTTASTTQAFTPQSATDETPGA